MHHFSEKQQGLVHFVTSIDFAILCMSECWYIQLISNPDLVRPIKPARPHNISALLEPFEFVMQVISSPQVSRPGMSFKILCSRGSPAQSTQLAASRVISDFLVGLCTKVLSHP